MKKLILLLLLIAPVVGSGQTKYDQYDELISIANNLKNEAYFEQAIETYRGAIDILTPPSSTPYFNLAECALMLGDFDLADRWIRQGISRGGAQMGYLRDYNGFKNIQEKDFYKKIISDYNSLRQQYFSTIDNIDLYLEVEELVARDQFVRKTGLYLDGYSEIDYQKAGDDFLIAQRENDTIKINQLKKVVFHQTNQKYVETTSELMHKVDSLNIARLMEITEKHGWQKRAWIILWHQRGTHNEDNYIWNYFRPVINTEIEEGKMSRNFWDPFNQFSEMINEIKSGISNSTKNTENQETIIKIDQDKIKG